MSDQLQPAAVVDTILRSPFFSAKLYPNAGRGPAYVVPLDRDRKQPAVKSSETLPLPPADWLTSWGGRDVFLVGGRNDVNIMRGVAKAHGYQFQPGSRVLEFGSSRGRMMRWLYDFAGDCDVYGVDVVAEDVVWCQKYLGAPFHYMTNTSYPNLPFEDGSFDFIYAGSVFTHISDIADMWILELRRLLRPGGKMYITIHDNHSVRVLYERGHVANNPWWGAVMKEYERVTEGRPLSDFQTVAILRGGPSMEQVFYDRDWVLGHWGQYLKFVALREEALSAFQTALLLEKE
jgi:SAM-dependent methyltransferase